MGHLLGQNYAGQGYTSRPTLCESNQKCCKNNGDSSVGKNTCEIYRKHNFQNFTAFDSIGQGYISRPTYSSRIKNAAKIMGIPA